MPIASVVSGKFKKHENATDKTWLNWLKDRFTKKKPEFVFDTTKDFLSYCKEIFFEPETFGNMLNNTRNGDSNESFVDGIFKRIGYVTTIKRQDDFGIDYLCTVGKKYGKSIYPTKSFMVQLKSNFDNIEYDLAKKGKNNWLLENNLPLFFCIYCEDTGFVYFYSTAMLNDFIIRDYKNIKKIIFEFRAPDGENIVPQKEEVEDTEIDYKINCGHPFLKISVFDTIKQTEKIKNYREILEKVIEKENKNILYRNLGLPFMFWLHNYKVNDKSILFGWADYSNTMIVSSDTLLDNLDQIIMTLCKTYYHEGKTSEYEHLKQIVDTIKMNKKNKTALENLGFRDKNGNII